MPFKVAVCGLPTPLSSTRTSPFAGTRDQPTAMSHDWPAPSCCEQVLEMRWKALSETLMLLMLSVDVPLLISAVVPWAVHEQPITRRGWHIKPKGSGLNSTSATCDAQVRVAVAVTAPLFAEADALTVIGPPSWR